MRYGRFCDVTTRTFVRKLAKLRGSVEDAVLNENANGKTPKDVNEKLYKMAISVFQNFGFFTPKISKNQFFLENDP